MPEEKSEAYLCDWFPRTKAHLAELYKFFVSAESHLPLDSGLLAASRKVLNIESVVSGFDQLEYIEILAKNGITTRIYADGLMVMKKEMKRSIKAELALLEEYYADRLSQALTYLFSIGAPVFRHESGRLFSQPQFVVIARPEHVSTAGLAELGIEIGLKIEGLKIYQDGSRYTLLKDGQNISQNLIRNFIESEAFLRIVSEQLHSYIDLHREVWGTIDKMRERGEVNAAVIRDLASSLNKYPKIAAIVEARLKQIESYISTRRRILEDDREMLKLLPETIEFSYQSLEDMVRYVQGLWEATNKYLLQVIDSFSKVEQKVTNSSINDLTIVASVGVGTALIGLFTKAPPQLTWAGAVYFVVLLSFGYGSRFVMRALYRRKRYRVDELVS